MAWINSSILRKIVMSVSGLFLISFLVVHLSINLLILVDKDLFNAASHFMGTNFIIQIMQYVLALGFLLHIILGIVLNIQNKKARPISYAKNKPDEAASWSSRNMIVTGVLILLFVILHLKDYLWEIKFGDMSQRTDYDLVVALFENPLYTFLYVFSFVLLGIHLDHGFQSSFQSIGANHSKYTPMIKKFGRYFSIVMALGFSSISLYFFITSL
jgi:succinate dehydrogenase cytochrome b subunit